MSLCPICLISMNNAVTTYVTVRHYYTDFIVVLEFIITPSSIVFRFALTECITLYTHVSSSGTRLNYTTLVIRRPSWCQFLAGLQADVRSAVCLEISSCSQKPVVKKL
jgi:hypothetical protein